MNNKERIGYDKSKVECFNCHKKDTLQGSAGHLRIKTAGTRSLQEGLDQAEEGPTNFALMAYSSISLSSSTNSEIMDKCKTGLGYNVIPPPYTGNFMPPKHDLVYHSLDDFIEVNESASESVVEKPTEPKTARKEYAAPIIEDWVS
ncbi:hypothetical protein Tco_0118394, partial [Tanacetum coccineum]